MSNPDPFHLLLIFSVWYMALVVVCLTSSLWSSALWVSSIYTIHLLYSTAKQLNTYYLPINLCPHLLDLQMKVGDLSSRDPDTRLRRFKPEFLFIFLLIYSNLQVYNSWSRHLSRCDPWVPTWQRRHRPTWQCLRFHNLLLPQCSWPPFWTRQNKKHRSRQ